MKRPQLPRSVERQQPPEPRVPEPVVEEVADVQKPATPVPETTVGTRQRGYFSATGAASVFSSKPFKQSEFEKRRKEVRRAKLRTFGMVGFGVFVGVSLIGFLSWGIFFSSFFALDAKQVTIVKGQEKVTQAEIDQLMLPWVGTPLARISTTEIADKVGELPLVKAATVSRDWPNGLKVSMDLRVPAFSEQIEGKWHVYDTEGVEIAVADQQASGTLAVELGAVETRVKALQLMTQVRSQLDADLLGLLVSMRSDGNLVEMVLQSTATVKWGDASDPEFKLKVLKILLNEAPAKVYDVSIPEKPVTRN